MNSKPVNMHLLYLSVLLNIVADGTQPIRTDVVTVENYTFPLENGTFMLYERTDGEISWNKGGNDFLLVFGVENREFLLLLLLLHLGEGLLNSLIDKLPYEVHIPNYSFCGPGTKLEKRLARGDKGINGLDEACKEHDIAYSKEKDLKRRHEADRILAKKALHRVFSSNSKFSEKLAALGVAGAMKAKVKLGMGYNLNSSQIVKKLERLKKNIENSLQTIEDFLNNIEQRKVARNKKRVGNYRKRKLNALDENIDIKKIKIDNSESCGQKRKVDDDDEDEDDDDDDLQKNPTKRVKL
ncbi:hypothetical protein NQ318_012093 [Aromia moschata]|uniref:Phospholipase A2-like domain-containing protein n=1 Tax=Aromia moschata TaxID=1265417 RepID=A0AAV8X6Z7_9CUCU|nr:hypothetical protein NQ318_012093 [Aromia moschata]